MLKVCHQPQKLGTFSHISSVRFFQKFPVSLVIFHAVQEVFYDNGAYDESVNLARYHKYRNHHLNAIYSHFQVIDALGFNFNTSTALNM